MTELIINDDNYRQYVRPMQDGIWRRRGCTARPVTAATTYQSAEDWKPDTMPMIPRSEWPDLISQQEQRKSRLSDMKDFPSLDQNGQGFCWAYSSTAAVMMVRKKNNQPDARLSAHAIAMQIFGFDRGAWGALSMDWLTRHGVPTVEYWPEQSMNKRHDTQEMKSNALNYKALEGWLDMNVEAYDAELTFDEIGSCLLQNVPVVLDFSWWGHSVLGVDVVHRPNTSQKFGWRILNSWGESWGNNGFGIIEGSRVHPMGACALRSVVGN